MLTVDGGLVAASQYSLPPFRVARPQDLDAALAAMERAEEQPTVLAGGTDLVAQIREGLKPADMVDISRVPQLAQIVVGDGRLTIGPLVTHTVGSRHDGVAEAVPGFARAWGRLANVRVRGRASLGGNLMARRTRYEGAILMAALGAQLRFAGPSGETVLAAHELWDASAIPDRALLTAIEIPLNRRPRLIYDRTFRPAMTVALALWRAGDSGDATAGRVVIATEWQRPVALDLAGPPASRAVLAREAADRAAQTLAQLPEVFADIAAGHDWLKRAASTLVARHLADQDGHPA